MKKILILIFVLISTFISAQINNSKWNFVGPISENLQNGNLFETSRLNKIAIDPVNELNLATAGFFGGLWISKNGGDYWESLPTHTIKINQVDFGFNGVAAIDFNNNNELFLANLFHPVITGDKEDRNMFTNKLFKYNFNTNKFHSLGDIPNNGQEYLVYKIKVNPYNYNEIFVGTSIGLFKSTNSGSTWFLVNNINHVIRDIEIEKNGRNQIVYYLSGTKIINGNTNNERRRFIGEPIVLRSIDGISFIELCDLKNSFSEVKNLLNGNGPDLVDTYCPEICIAKRDLLNNTDWEVLYIYTSVLKENKVSIGRYNLQRLDINGIQNSCDIIQTSIINDGRDHTPHRLAIDFDPLNEQIYYGGVTLKRNSVGAVTDNKRWGTSSLITSPHQIHDDIQDIIIKSNKIYVASDGGINISTINSNNQVLFEAKNNGLNIALINGFSGASKDPNYYLIGLQDIIHTQLFDQSILKNRFTPETHENDGGVINNFNNNLIVLDKSSYFKDYQVSLDGGESLSKIYDERLGGNKFGVNTYFQDPFRNRKYLGLMSEIQEYDFIQNRFNPKIKFNNCSNLSSDFYNTIIQMSFNRNNPNKIHVITSSEFKNGNVFKFIGDNFDEIKDPINSCNKNNLPNWQDITPTWGLSSNVNNSNLKFNYILPSQNLTRMTSMVSSNLDENVIYISLRKDLDKNVTVIKYENGFWYNYSQGIPESESVSTMVIDVESNDGIYAVTEKSVYYRDLSLSSWIKFDNNWPKTLSKQIEINQLERTLRAGTYGKGIWKTALKCPDKADVTESDQTIDNKFVEANNIYSTAIIKSNNYVVYKAANQIVLNNGFKAESGCSFKAYIQTCENQNYENNNEAYFDKRGTIQNLFNNTTPINLKKDSLNNEQVFNLNLFPNPSNGLFTLEANINFENAILKIYDLNGKLLINQTLNPSVKKQELDLREFGIGMYFINFIKGDINISKKIIIN